MKNDALTPYFFTKKYKMIERKYEQGREKYRKRSDKKRNVNYSSIQNDTLTKQSDKALNEKSKGE